MWRIFGWNAAIKKYQMQDCLALICIKDVGFHPRPEHEPAKLLGRGLSGRGKK